MKRKVTMTKAAALLAAAALMCCDVFLSGSMPVAAKGSQAQVTTFSVEEATTGLTDSGVEEVGSYDKLQRPVQSFPSFCGYYTGFLDLSAADYRFRFPYVKLS